MLYTVTPRERGTMYQDRLAFVDTAASWVFPVITVLMARWAKELGQAKVAVFTAIVHMTLANGRAACELPISVFDKGNTDSEECPVFSGLGMSLNSARTHLDGLCEDDFIDVYRILAKESKTEASARVVEINFKKLFSPKEIALAGIKMGLYTPSKFWRGPYEYIHRYFVPSLSSLGLDKSNLFPTGFAASVEAGEVATTQTHAKTMLPTPKKQRVVKQHEESTLAVITRVTQSSMAARQARAATASTGSLDKQGLQALIDTAMQAYLPHLPRVLVTDKPFSVLRKRLKESRLENLSDFIDYTIRSWYSIATQNKAAHRKDPTKRERGESMPSSPNFLTLAYKFPYFLAVYSNHLMDTSKEATTKTATERHVVVLETQLQQLRRDNEALRRRTFTPRTRPKPKETAQVELDDEWVPPEWTEGKVKKA